MTLLGISSDWHTRQGVAGIAQLGIKKGRPVGGLSMVIKQECQNITVTGSEQLVVSTSQIL